MKPSKYSFIDCIRDDFKQLWEEEHSPLKYASPIGKDRAAIGWILKEYKKAVPGSNSEETKEGLKKYFRLCIKIKDGWLYNNMGLSIIMSKFNTINIILRNGKTNKKGATGREIAESIIRNFKVG